MSTPRREVRMSLERIEELVRENAEDVGNARHIRHSGWLASALTRKAWLADLLRRKEAERPKVEAA